MLRALGGIAGAPASQESAEGALLDLAERIAEVSGAVGFVGEPWEYGSAATSTCGPSSCFLGHAYPNRGAIFVARLFRCSSAAPDTLGANRDRHRLGPRIPRDHIRAMPQLAPHPH